MGSDVVFLYCASFIHPPLHSGQGTISWQNGLGAAAAAASLLLCGPALLPPAVQASPSSVKERSSMVVLDERPSNSIQWKQQQQRAPPQGLLEDEPVGDLSSEVGACYCE